MAGRRSWGEWTGIEQLELRLEALQQNDAEKVAAPPIAIVNAEPAARPARRPLPAHLPRSYIYNCAG